MNFVKMGKMIESKWIICHQETKTRRMVSNKYYNFNSVERSTENCVDKLM
jgi:hypothetical protein